MESSPGPLAITKKLTLAAGCPHSLHPPADISLSVAEARGPIEALPISGRSGRSEEGSGTMSAVAVSSSLNPDAPPFIPAALLQVEDFSPQWWDLITTTAWFRDHWSREHAHLDEMAEQLDAAGFLPDDEDLFYDDQLEQAPAVVEPAPAAVFRTDAVLKALNLQTSSSPKGGDAPRVFRESQRHSEKPTKYAGSTKSSAPRVIHQPR